MAAQTNAAEFSAEMVGLAFVDEFYGKLHSSPEIVHCFYNDQSTMIRPDSTGRLVTVTTTEEINDLVLSLDCEKFIVELLAVDTQASYMGGLTVLVTACLIGLDNVRRVFVESFFLAPQEHGYVVLNDTFRFIDECDVAVTVSEKEQCDAIAATTPVSTVAVVEETAEVADSSLENNTASVKEIVETKIVETVAVEEIVETNAVEEVVETAAVKEVVETALAPVAQQKTTTVVEAVRQAATESNHRAEPAVEALPNGVVVAPKKMTYAELLKNPNQVSSAFPVHKRAAPAKPVKRVEAANSAAAPVSQNKVTTAPAATATAAPKSASVPASQIPATTAPAATGPAVNGRNGNVRSNDHASSNGQVAAKGFSIYIGHLPYDAKPELVEQEFKQFGPIKKNGVQVRSNQGYVFGFVEYEDASAQEKALEMGKIQIGGKEVHIEEKKATVRADGYTGRGGYRNDGYRRGSYSNGRGYARNDNGNRRNGEGAPRGRGNGNGNAYVNGGGKDNGDASVNSGGRGARQGAATK